MLLGSLLEEFVPGLILGDSLSSSSSQFWFWHLEVDVILIIVVIELDIHSLSLLNGFEILIVKEIISVIFVIELDVLRVSLMVVMVLLVSSVAFLGIISLVILVEESIVVASWRELCVMKFLMVIANSWEILWSVNNIWVISGLKILVFSTVESLRWVIEIEPVGTWLSWLVVRALHSFSVGWIESL